MTTDDSAFGFSVVMAIYNTPQLTRECLDSLMAAARHAHHRIEVICVDDGSTDETPLMLDAYAAGDNPKNVVLSVVHKKNGGQGSARNAGLDRAHGQWVLFVDGDDLVFENFFSVLEECWEQCGDVDFIRYGEFRFVSSDEITSTRRRVIPAPVRHDISGSFSHNDVPEYCFCVACANRVVKALRFENYAIGEDLLFGAKLMLVARSYASIKAAIYGYRQRSGSISYKPLTFVKARDRMKAWREVIAVCESSQGRAGVSYVRHYCTQLMEFAVYSGNTLGKRLDKESQRKLWAIWQDTLRDIVQLRVISSFQRLRIRVYFLCPCRFWAKVLFAGPYALKLLRNTWQGMVRRRIENKV